MKKKAELDNFKDPEPESLMEKRSGHKFNDEISWLAQTNDSVSSRRISAYIDPVNKRIIDYQGFKYIFRKVNEDREA